MNRGVSAILLVVAMAMIAVMTIGDPAGIDTAVKRLFGWHPDLPRKARLVPQLVAQQLRFVASATTVEEVREQIERFAGFGSRVTGYPGAQRAYQYIKSRFGALGLRDVRTDTFEVAVPVDRPGGEVIVSGTQGRSLPLFSLWPNGVRTSTVKPDGVIGPLIHSVGGSW